MLFFYVVVAHLGLFIMHNLTYIRSSSPLSVSLRLTRKSIEGQTASFLQFSDFSFRAFAGETDMSPKHLGLEKHFCDFDSQRVLATQAVEKHERTVLISHLVRTRSLWCRSGVH